MSKMEFTYGAYLVAVGHLQGACSYKWTVMGEIRFAHAYEGVSG